MPNIVVDALLCRKYVSAIHRRMRDLIEALVSLDQFKNSAAHLAVIMAFELAVLLSPSGGDASPDFDNNMAK